MSCVLGTMSACVGVQSSACCVASGIDRGGHFVVEEADDMGKHLKNT